MADTRKDKRAPVSLKVRFKSATVDEFIEQYAKDISRGGIFIKSKAPMAVGTLLKFEFQLKDESRLIHGVGRVVWKRDSNGGGSEEPAGMGIKFIKMDAESRALVEQIVATRGGDPGQYDAGRGPDASDPPPSTSFFPSSTPPAQLPKPEDRTQVRHASEFLATALAGADSEAAAEAAERAAEARLRTEEIQRVREAEIARRKADSASPEGLPAAEVDPAAATQPADVGELIAATAASEPPPEEPSPERTARESEGVVPSGSGKSGGPVVVASLPDPDVAPPTRPASGPPPATRAKETRPVGLPLLIGTAALAGIGYWAYADRSASHTADADVAAAAEAPDSESRTPVGAAPAPPPVATPPDEAEPSEAVADPSAAAADAPTTSVRVVSRPVGSVWVGGAEQGTTPVDVSLPIGQEVQVVVRAAGYTESRQSVVAREEHPALRFELAALPYVIAVQTTPPGATVLAAGQQTTSPGEIALKSAPRRALRVVALKQGHLRASQLLPKERFSELDGRMVATVSLPLAPRPPPAARPPAVAAQDPASSPAPAPAASANPRSESATPAVTPRPESQTPGEPPPASARATEEPPASGSSGEPPPQASTPGEEQNQ